VYGQRDQSDEDVRADQLGHVLVLIGEVERVDLNEGEIRAALEHLGLPGVLGAWRKIAEDEESAEADIEISGSLNRLAEDVQRERQVESLLRSLDAERERCERELRELNGLLDNESRECERMRVSTSYGPRHDRLTMQPSDVAAADSEPRLDEIVDRKWEV
jgi:hypothetical protein